MNLLIMIRLESEVTLQKLKSKKELSLIRIQYLVLNEIQVALFVQIHKIERKITKKSFFKIDKDQNFFNIKHKLEI